MPSVGGHGLKDMAPVGRFIGRAVGAGAITAVLGNGYMYAKDVLAERAANAAEVERLTKLGEKGKDDLEKLNTEIYDVDREDLFFTDVTSASEWTNLAAFTVLGLVGAIIAKRTKVI